MPRIVTKRKGRLSTQIRAERAAIQRFRKGQWFDPFGWVQGTLPEKMVYAELSRRNIRFAFQNEIAFVIPEIDFNKTYRPDIAIPDLKIIIEVQGSYWHSTDEAIENDAYKFAIYQTLGWKVLVWWDYEITTRLQDLFAAEPLLGLKSPQLHYQAPTEYVYTKKRTIDDSKGIRTLNYRRGQRMQYKKAAPRVKIKQTKGRQPNGLY